MDLNECAGCRSLGECCRFSYVMNAFRIRTDIRCPYLKKNGLCGVFAMREDVPWCDHDAVKNRGTVRAVPYPGWCPHGTASAPLTFDELFTKPPFSIWTEVQRADFRAFVNRQVIEQFRAGYPEWAHLLGPEGRSTVREAREGDPSAPVGTGPGPERTGGVGEVAREERAPDRSPGTGAGEGGAADVAPPG